MSASNIKPHHDKRPGVILLADKEFMRGLYKSMKPKPAKNIRRMG